MNLILCLRLQDAAEQAPGCCWPQLDFLSLSRAVTKFRRSMAVTMPNTICRLLEEPSVWSAGEKREFWLQEAQTHQHTPTCLVLVFVKWGGWAIPAPPAWSCWVILAQRGNTKGTFGQESQSSDKDFQLRRAPHQKGHWNFMEGRIRIQWIYCSWHKNSNQALLLIIKCIFLKH